MAEGGDDTERSEDPTQKRLDEALERGDVVKSQEVNTWFIIAGATLILSAFSGAMGNELTTTLRGLIANSHAIRVDGRGFLGTMSKLGIEVIAAVAIPLLLLVLAAAAGNLIQHRLVWSSEALRPKFSKISPIAGLGRLFSKQALANFVKGLLKLTLIGGIMTALLWPQRHRLESMVAVDPAAILPLAQSLSLDMLGAVVAVLALIAAADYLFQYRQWFERQKMSLREMKEEFKQSEGDPMVKAKIRQIAPGPQQETDDGRRAAGFRRHHQSDALRGRAAIRARHDRAGLRGQGRRRAGAQDPRGRRRARHSDRRESPARPCAACHGRDRSGDPGGALPGGGRDHRLRHAAQPVGHATKRLERNHPATRRAAIGGPPAPRSHHVPLARCRRLGHSSMSRNERFHVDHDAAAVAQRQGACAFRSHGESRSSGSIVLVLLIALALVGAVGGLLLVGRATAEPFIVALLALLATVGVFLLFALAAGILRVAGRDAVSPLLKSVVDGAGEGILVTDAGSRVLYANAAYLESGRGVRSAATCARWSAFSSAIPGSRRRSIDC